jgi:hypothetical protein
VPPSSGLKNKPGRRKESCYFMHTVPTFLRVCICSRTSSIGGYWLLDNFLQNLKSHLYCILTCLNISAKFIENSSECAQWY